MTQTEQIRRIDHCANSIDGIAIDFFLRLNFHHFFFTGNVYIWVWILFYIMAVERKYSTKWQKKIFKQFEFESNFEAILISHMLCWFKINTLVSEHEIEIVSEKMLKKTESEILKFCYENKQNSSLLLNFFSHLLFRSSIY